MIFNIDFELAAMCFQLICILFFLIRRHLPTKQNLYFKITMVVSFFVTLLDTLSAVASSYAELLPMPLVVIVNMIFFCVLPVLPLVFLIYTLSLTRQLHIVKTILFAIYCIPFVIIELMAFSTPVTGFLFYFDSSINYCHGGGYYIEFAFNAFYVMLALVYAIIYRKNISKLQYQSIVMFCVLQLAATVLQGVFFNWVLIAYAITSMALVIIYMSLQNPDIYMDKNTRLFNKTALAELLAEDIREEKSFSLIMLNIDEFRTLTSLYGMEKVEQCMEQIGMYFNRTFREVMVFRVASERFIMKADENVNFNEIESIIRERFERAFQAGEQLIEIHIGITYLPYSLIREDTRDILNIMVFSLEQLTQMGNDVTIIIDDKMIERMNRDIAVERAIDRAIENNSLQIYYQPVYSVKDGRMSSCEALARLFDDEIGFIPPKEFIRKAEENGSILMLGKQIYEKVLMFMRDNDLSRFGIDYVSINLSAVQCMQENLAEEMIDMAQTYNVGLDRINLEINETATNDKKHMIKRNMKKLIEMGVHFSLDNYGTGYSKLVSILELPFTIVKIDKSLVWTYFEEINDVLPDVITMFHNQNLKIVVGGVESHDVLMRVREMGCDYIQGFQLSKPVPTVEFLNFIRENNRISREV